MSLDLASERPLTSAELLTEVSLPHPCIEPAGDRTLGYHEHRHDFLYFVVRGTLYSDGDHVARVFAHGQSRPIFYAGVHPFTGAEVAVPQRSEVDRCHLLHPGRSALFEIRAVTTIWDIPRTIREKILRGTSEQPVRNVAGGPGNDGGRRRPAHRRTPHGRAGDAPAFLVRLA
jgi:hypothetical protein